MRRPHEPHRGDGDGRGGLTPGAAAEHFDSVPALLIEVGSRVLRLRTDTLRAWLDGTGPENVVPLLAELIHHQLTKQRASSVVAYELGARHEEFRQASRVALGSCSPGSSPT